MKSAHCGGNSREVLAGPCGILEAGPLLGLEGLEKAYPRHTTPMNKPPKALCLFSTVFLRYKDDL